MGGGEYHRGDVPGGLGMSLIILKHRILRWKKRQCRRVSWCVGYPMELLKRIRTWFWKRRVNRSIRVLDELDWNLRRIGWSRQQRRHFWIEFSKKQQVRTDVFNRMTQG